MRISRRKLFQAAAPALVSFIGSPEKVRASGDYEVPLKIGIRAASMRDPEDDTKSMVGNFDVFREATTLSGIRGVELQVAHGEINLRDLDAVRRYKREAHRWGTHIPSTAGVWDEGVSIYDSPVAGSNLLQSIKATELLGASVALVFFDETILDMTKESSYGPVVQLLQKAAPYAADAGVILGLENFMNTESNIKLVDVIDHPNVKIYFDAFNMADHGLQSEVYSAALRYGRDRICSVHIKNGGGWGGTKLVTEHYLFDWTKVIETLNRIEYDGWIVLETAHTSARQCREATASNVDFIQKHIRMPVK